MSEGPSRSVIALAVALAAALVLGLTTWVPRWVGPQTRIAGITPGMLVVEPAAAATVPLGDGYAVELGETGFAYTKDGLAMLRTVRRGSPVVALTGEARAEEGGTGALREHIDTVLDRVTFTGVRRDAEAAIWAGRVEGAADTEGRTPHLLLEWRVKRTGDALVTTVSVPGADGTVIPLVWQPGVVGVAPGLPARNLRQQAWWFTPGSGQDGAFDWFLGTRVGLGPAQVARALDLRADGHLDLHAWSATSVVTVSGTPRPPSR